MFLSFIDDLQLWLRENYLCSISETAFSAFKRSYSKPLRKRIRLYKKLVAFARACDYNLKRLCYLKHLEGITIMETWNA